MTHTHKSLYSIWHRYYVIAKLLPMPHGEPALDTLQELTGITHRERYFQAIQRKTRDSIFPLMTSTFHLFLYICHLSCLFSSPQAWHGWPELARMYRTMTYEWNDKQSQSKGKPLIIQIALGCFWVVKVNVTSLLSGPSVSGCHCPSQGLFTISKLTHFLLTLCSSESVCLEVTRMDYWSNNSNSKRKTDTF